MMAYDYIIVGAGTAGCVLAGKLSENPAKRVLLLEAGPEDRNQAIHIPKGFGRLLGDPTHAWHLPTDRQKASGVEVWARGKVLGGSSAINGMVYVRGQPEDYDNIAAAGNPGWGWSDIAPCFKRLENHVLGADEWRGAGGPVTITQASPSPLGEAIITAGRQLNLTRKVDLNRPDQQGIGYLNFNIDHRGERVSAARAFLHPARKRPNLTVVTGVTVDRVLFEGRMATGVEGRIGEAAQRWHGREVILSAGGLQTPKLLQLSGVGPAALLRDLGIDVVQDSPGVGANMREHFLLMLQYGLRNPRDSQNKAFSGLPLLMNGLRYKLTRGGPLASGSYQVGGFATVMPGATRPDAQLMFAPFSLDLDNPMMAFNDQPGMQFFGYPLRSDSQGSIRIASSNPRDPAVISPNYLATEHDRAISVATVQAMRKLMSDPALAPFITNEMNYTASAKTPDEILSAFRTYGQSGYHACGTARMGNDDGAVLDEKLRVRGVGGLRVMDCSILPEMISGNTNGPMMAMALRAAEVIAGSPAG